MPTSPCRSAGSSRGKARRGRLGWRSSGHLLVEGLAARVEASPAARGTGSPLQPNERTMAARILKGVLSGRALGTAQAALPTRATETTDVLGRGGREGGKMFASSRAFAAACNPRAEARFPGRWFPSCHRLGRLGKPWTWSAVCAQEPASHRNARPLALQRNLLDARVLPSSPGAIHIALEFAIEQGTNWSRGHTHWRFRAAVFREPPALGSTGLAQKGCGGTATRPSGRSANRQVPRSTKAEPGS